MSNPVLVEVFRGETVESRHRGAVIVTDGDGKIVFSLGDIERPTFPRSAIKAIQALPLVESGAADAYGFGNEELAMACASHSGEPQHVAKAADMLGRAGLDLSALECGSHWPTQQPVLIALAKSGQEPTPLHNNCSGKHAGFLCTCRHLGIETHGYSALGSPEQDMVRDAMQSVTGAPHTLDRCGTDGCSIPTYAIPLRNLAHGFARMATGTGIRAGPCRSGTAPCRCGDGSTILCRWYPSRLYGFNGDGSKPHLRKGWRRRRLRRCVAGTRARYRYQVR